MTPSKGCNLISIAMQMQGASMLMGLHRFVQAAGWAYHICLLGWWQIQTLRGSRSRIVPFQASSWTLLDNKGRQHMGRCCLRINLLQGSVAATSPVKCQNIHILLMVIYGRVHVL